MIEASSANFEMAIILPMGVVANQLMRIESDLRALDMKALNFVKEHDNRRHIGLIEASLEHINETLDSIRSLMSDIEADIHPSSPNVTRTSTKIHSAEMASDSSVGDTHIRHSEYSNRNPRPDRDD